MDAGAADTDHLSSLEYSMMTGTGSRTRAERHGPWTLHDDAGVLRVEGQFRRGREHGLFRYWSANGELEGERRWVDGVARGGRWWQDGHLETTDEEGPNGARVVTHFFASGRISRRTATRGRRERTKSWYSTGARERTWTTVGGKYVGTTRWFDAAGARDVEQSDSRTRKWQGDRLTWEVGRCDGAHHGHGRILDLLGTELRSDEWRAGKRHGASRSVTADGTRAVSRWRRGSRHGAATLSWPNGRRRWRADFRDDQLHGEVRAWHPTGELERVGTVDHGRMVGTWRWHEPDGTVRAELSFVDGKLLLPAQIELPTGRITVRRRAEADAVVRIDQNTGALDVDEHGRLALVARRDVDRLARTERARTAAALWPGTEPPIRMDPTEVAGDPLAAADGTEVQLVRRRNGSMSVRRRRGPTKRWVPILDLGTGTTSDRPVVRAFEVSPDARHLVLVTDVDGRELDHELRVIEIDSGRVVHADTVARQGWDPDGQAAVWTANSSLVHVTTRGDTPVLARWPEPLPGPVKGAGDAAVRARPGWVRLIAFPRESGARPGVALVDTAGALAVLDMETGYATRDVFPSGREVAVSETDSWVTVVVDHRHVLAAPTPLTSPDNDWRLVRTTPFSTSVRDAAFDGRTLATIEGRSGRPCVRVAVEGIPPRWFAPAQLGFVPIGLAVRPDGAISVRMDGEASVDVSVRGEITGARGDARHVQTRTAGGETVAMTVWEPPSGPIRGAVVVAYGGYGVCTAGLHPTMRDALLDRGIAVVAAHVRGGGERGALGHAAGRGSRKEQTLRELDACVDHVQRHLAPRVVLDGGSHGALVVSSVAHRRAGDRGVRGLVLTVPQLDLWHDQGHHHELAPWELAEPIERDIVRAMSPYATMPSVVRFDVLAVTGSSDARVAWHSAARYVRRARTRAADGVLTSLWMEDGTGHGLGSGSMYEARQRVAVEFITRSIERD